MANSDDKYSKYTSVQSEQVKTINNINPIFMPSAENEINGNYLVESQSSHKSLNFKNDKTKKTAEKS